MKFYASIGKKPILLRKEMPGHVANRLQLALYREVLYLVEQEVLSVGDADAAVSWGPGLRWALMGPSLQYHVSGGAGGIHHFLQGVFEGLLPVFKTLGDPKITPELKSKIAEGALQEAGSRSIEQLTNTENEQLVALLKVRAGRN
jgi:3-hydroxyacyl-CoA dehydrogenase